ncbi:hypothetical protein CVT25_015628 [Psilocybe cyanescens]|uniref:SET domain-containing protein n=1 Tax=Psilocybe cyanescens TaxID=93625 RepID=A0A409WHV0_PSICY|nr:hypothetical protein CVT25_015628 [Psilocybe cyanescens]
MNGDHLSEQIHPGWNALVQWLSDPHCMDISIDKLPVVARSSPGAGYGLFSLRSIEPSAPLFSIPAQALLNSLTLAPHYPSTRPKLTCTQAVSLHLMLHRSVDGHSSDPLFGPYISVLPNNFDSHPFSWLWKKRHDPDSLSLDTQLANILPRRILEKLDKMTLLFEEDWKRTQDYLRNNPTLLDKKTGTRIEEDYLWGWLNVNTRCVYHRLAKTRSDGDNMTLCPILDFANHTTKPPYTTPETTRAELWDTGPSAKKKFGDNFVLLSPSSAASPAEELYLKYGAHSSATLFSEYGFVSNPDPAEQSDETLGGQMDLGSVIEHLFERRGVVGSWMKDVLIEEGYWGDWTLHSSPAPAHPSYRLITTLRLYHLVPRYTQSIPSNVDAYLQDWRDTILGKKYIISKENESLWRGTLKKICESIVNDAVEGLGRTAAIDGSEGSPEWLDSSRTFVSWLWQEEIDVSTSVIGSLDQNEEF